MDSVIEATARHHGSSSIVPHLSSAGDFRPRLVALGDESSCNSELSSFVYAVAELCELDRASWIRSLVCNFTIVVEAD